MALIKRVMQAIQRIFIDILHELLEKKEEQGVWELLRHDEIRETYWKGSICTPIADKFSEFFLSGRKEIIEHLIQNDIMGLPEWMEPEMES